MGSTNEQNKEEDVVLEVTDLHVQYSSNRKINHAVNGVSIKLKRGENLGLVGETGAGKTTTVLSILGLLPQRTGKITQGSIKFCGQELVGLKNEEMRSLRGNKIGMIFQDPMTSLNPVLTIGDQIAEVIALHSDKGRTKESISEETDRILRLTGISPERKNDYPHQFSGGMRQRVMISIAIACSPELLIADEPTTALDVTIQAQVLDMMDDLKRELQTSMILITHDLGIVAQMCNHVAIMYSGEIVEYGTLEDIFSGEKHHPYTEGLFGSIPDITKDVKRLTPIGGQMTDPAALPEGCLFHPRCPECMEICKTVRPGVVTSGTHQIRCHCRGQKENS